MSKDRMLDELSVLQERFASGMGWRDGEYAEALDEAIELINNMPSADVVEVKHGEWKHNKNNDVIKCSECGFGIMDSTFVWEIGNCCGTIEDNPFNFCPNCGADMRGETK